MAFKMRTTKPEAGNKYYIRKANGGYSNAILGSPVDKDCNVLSNCVGYAYGRFNEIGGYGSCKYLAPVNAENFMQYKGSCQTGMTPKLGACMVWQKGSTLGGSDGAGHVAIVEKVVSDTEVVTSESGYGNSTPFWTQTRKKGGGNWGANSSYKFLGFIYNPAVSDDETVTTQSSVKGIDVSKWQGEIDWKKVKAAGIKFAMIRLGYGSANGTECGTDGYFEKNVAGAIAAGVDIGCYFYSYALSVEAAKKEAEYVVGVLAKHKGAFTYPIAFDIEDGSQQSLGKKTLTDMVIAFGDAIEKAGYYCSVYANLNWFKNVLDDSRLTRFDHWLAQWASAPTYTGEFGIWQSSSTGKVDGISGNVDTDVAYKDYPTAIKGKKLNGFTSADQKPTAPSTGVNKPAAPTAPSTPASSGIKAGSLVVITGTKYYSGTTIPAWVKEKKWYVREVSGDRAVIDKSEDGKNAICSPVNVRDLALASGNTEKPWTPAVGDKVKCKVGVTKFADGTTMAKWVPTAVMYVRRIESGGSILLVSTEPVKNEYTGRVKATDVQKA